VEKSMINAALLIAAITTAVGARAGEPRPPIPAELVLERFSVAKGGECSSVVSGWAPDRGISMNTV
jgi:hypothetical protein